MTIDLRSVLLSLTCLGLALAPVGCGKPIFDDFSTGAETDAGSGDSSTGDGDSATGDGDSATGDGDSATGDGDSATGDGDGDGSSETGDALPDQSYLFALETSLGPDLPLQFVLDVVNRVSTPEGATADFVFQSLTLVQGGVEPGMCIGAPLEFNDVAFDLDGNFDLDLGLVMIDGAANPVTGSDIEATLELAGQLVGPNTMCGNVAGLLMSPLEFDLAGSTFAAIPLDGGCLADPFPAPAYDCSML